MRSRRLLQPVLRGRLTIEVRPVRFVADPQRLPEMNECFPVGPEGGPLEGQDLLEVARHVHAECILARATSEAAFRLAGALDPEESLAIVVHGAALTRDLEFVPFLADSADRYGIALSRLVLSLRDMPAPSRALLTSLRGLRDIGVRTAWQARALFRGVLSAESRPNYVKLDADNIRGIASDLYRQILMGSTVELCRKLGILPIAEGVREPHERQALAIAGVSLAQGPLFSQVQESRHEETAAD